MSLDFAIQNEISNMSDLLGKGLRYGSFAALLAMTVIGTVAVDIVVIAALSKNRNRNSPVFYFSHSAFSLRGNVCDNVISLMVYSALMTTLAVALSLVLSVPMVGLGLVSGWALVAGLYAAGELCTRFAALVKPNPADFERPFSSPQSVSERFGNFFRRPAPPQDHSASSAACSTATPAAASAVGNVTAVSAMAEGWQSATVPATVYSVGETAPAFLGVSCQVVHLEEGIQAGRPYTPFQI